MGAARNYYHDASDSEYVKVLAAEYDLNTPENACKWSETEPRRGGFNFSQCSAVDSFAVAANSSFRGHNLCWGNYNPPWLLNGTFLPGELQQVLATHVTTAIKHFAPNNFLCWDVVNEAFGSAEHNGSFFKPADPWYPALPDYVHVAFQAARETVARFPAGLHRPMLFYNDYGAEGLNPKSDVIYAWAKGMKQQGLLDGVGLQMHVSTSYFPPPKDVAANIARLGALGLDVHITEMDVKCEDGCGDTQLAQQAQIYANMLHACLNHTACRSFETWGFTDKYTWLGSDLKPLPFDDSFHAKPAVAAMLDVLQNH